MTNKELIEKLELAQKILDEVYSNTDIESVRMSMSVADCAIFDSLVAIEKANQ